MRVNKATNTLIQIAEQNIEDVESFTYLGSIINKTGGTEEDIKSSIGKARHVFVTLKPVWNNRNILLKTKLTIFNSNVKSVLLYGSETWKHTKALDSRLQVFVNTCLRSRFWTISLTQLYQDIYSRSVNTILYKKCNLEIKLFLHINTYLESSSMVQ